MIFTCDVITTGVEKRVTADGNIYITLNTCSFDENVAGNMFFNVKPDCICEGFKSIEELPRFSHCILTLNYLTTSKGNFFVLNKIQKLDK